MVIIHQAAYCRATLVQSKFEKRIPALGAHMGTVTPARLKKIESTLVIPGLTAQTFSHHMEAMKLHYTVDARGASHPYQLPIHLTNPVDKHGAIVATSYVELIAESKIQDATNRMNTSIQGVFNTASGSLTKSLAQLKADNDLQAFKDRLEQDRRKTLDTLNKAVNDGYDQILAAGLQVSAVQPLALSTSQKIGIFISTIATSIATFFANFVSLVVKVVNSVIEWLVKAEQAVSDWIDGAVHSAEDFFTGLF
jgi:hypothetical protein